MKSTRWILKPVAYVVSLLLLALVTAPITGFRPSTLYADTTCLTQNICTAANTTGNAGTATSLAANGTNCSVAGEFPKGIDANGNAENCTAVPTPTITAGSTPTSGYVAGEIIASSGAVAAHSLCFVDPVHPYLQCTGGTSETPTFTLENGFTTTTLFGDASGVGGVGSNFTSNKRISINAGTDVFVNPGNAGTFYISNSTFQDSYVVYGPPGLLGRPNTYVDAAGTVNGMVYWDSSSTFGFDFTAGTTYRIGAPWGFSTTDASVASATALPIQGNVIFVTGVAVITSLLDNDGADESYKDGACITLIFEGVTTLTDGNNLKMAGNFVTTADDTWTGCRHGGNWYETARSVN